MAKVILEIGGDDSEAQRALQNVANGFSDVNQAAKESNQAQTTAFKNVGQSAVKASQEIKKTVQELGGFKKEAAAIPTEPITKATNAFAALRKEIKDLKAAAIEAGETSPIGQEFLNKAAQAQDRLNDLNDSVKRLASDTSLFDAFLQGGQVIASGFSIAQGAAALFGEENEEVQKALLKVQGAMSVVNGLTAIQNALQKESALRLTLTAAATRIYNVSVGILSGNLSIATVATNVLNVATKALLGPVGIVIGLIGAAVAAYFAFSEETEKLTDKQDRLNESFQKSIERIKELEDAAQRSIASQKKLAKELGDIDEQLAISRGASDTELAKIREQNREKQLRLDQEALNERLLALKAEEDANREQIAALQRLFEDATDEEAKKIGQEKSALEKRNREIRSLITEANTDIETLRSGFAAEGLKKRNEEAKKERDQRADNLRKLRQLEIDNITDELAQRFAQERFNFLKEVEAAKGNQAIIEQLQIKHQRNLSKILDDGLLNRLKLQEDSAKDQKEAQEEANQNAIAANLAFIDKSYKDSTDAERKKVEAYEKAEAERIVAAQQILSSLTDIFTGEIDAELKKLDQKKKVNDEIIQNSESRIDKLEAQLDRELRLNEQGFASNITLVQQQIAAEQQAKENALAEDKKIKEEQAKLARQKIALESIEQAASLVTSSANLFKVLSPLGPPGIALAIATTAAMVGAFAAAKIQAIEATKQQGFHDGGYTGDGNEWSEAGVVHKEEFVSTKKTTKKHRKILEAMHQDDYSNLTMPDLAPILKGAGIRLMDDVPERISAKQTRYREAQAAGSQQALINSSELLKEMRQTRKEITDFKALYKDKPDIKIQPDGTKIIKQGNNTRIIKPRSK